MRFKTTVSILLFIALLVICGSVQLHLKTAPQIYLLMYGGFVFAILSMNERGKAVTFFFYILLGLLFWMGFFAIMQWIVSYDPPKMVHLGNGLRVRRPGMGLSGIIYIPIGLIVATIALAIYHSTNRPSHRAETIFSGAYTLQTFILLLADL